MMKQPAYNASAETLRWPAWCSPVEQSVLWVGKIPLYDWQVDVLNAAADPHSRVCVSALNESGKSNVVAVVFLYSVMAAFPGAKCYATSGNELQLKEQLFSILAGIANKHQGWKVSISEMRITMPNGSTCICSVKKDAESVEGVHGYVDPTTGIYCPVAYFVDEAKHIENAKQFAIRRIDPDFYLAMSTPPTEMEANMDWFWKGINYDALDVTVRKRERQLAEQRAALPPIPTGAKRKPPLSPAHVKPFDMLLAPDPIHSFPGEYWTYRRIITWREDHVPHLFTEKKRRERENIEKEFGRKSAYVQSMLYGVASAGTSINPIFSEDEIALVRQAMTPNSPFKAMAGDTRSSADVSGTADGDAMVFMVRHGTEVLWIETAQGDDVAQAEFLVQRNKALGIAPYQFTIDAGGVGANIANRMEQTLGYHGVSRFQSNNDPTFDYQFADRYSELHWVFKELLAYRAIVLPWCPLLIRDMRERRYVEMSGVGRLKTEEKKLHRKRTGHSPDYLDALIFLLSDFPIDRVRKGLALTRSPEDKGPAGRAEPPWRSNMPRIAPMRPSIMPGLRPLPSWREVQRFAMKR